MTQAAVGQFVARNVTTALTKELTHAEFMGCNPSSFSGNVDTKKFLKWFEELEIIFQSGDCRKEDKVKFATCSFQEHAQKWWTKYVLEPYFCILFKSRSFLIVIGCLTIYST